MSSETYLQCPCGTVLTISPKLAGNQVRCPSCQAVLKTPAGEDPFADLPQTAASDTFPVGRSGTQRHVSDTTAVFPNPTPAIPLEASGKKSPRSGDGGVSIATMAWCLLTVVLVISIILLARELGRRPVAQESLASDVEQIPNSTAERNQATSKREPSPSGVLVPVVLRAVKSRPLKLSERETLMRDATRWIWAHRDQKAERIVGSMVGLAVEFQGGVDRAVQNSELIMSAMRRRSLAIQSHDIRPEATVYAMDDQLISILEIELSLSGTIGGTKDKTFWIAVSTDDAATWTFLDEATLDASRGMMATLFPELVGELPNADEVSSTLAAP